MNSEQTKIFVTMTRQQLRLLGEAVYARVIEANAGNIDEFAPSDFERLDELSEHLNSPELSERIYVDITARAR